MGIGLEGISGRLRFEMHLELYIVSLDLQIYAYLSSVIRRERRRNFR